MRQLHAKMLPISLASLGIGALVGFLLIFVWDSPEFGFMLGYSAKFLVDILCYSTTLFGNSRASRWWLMAGLKDSRKIPVQLYLENLGHSFSVFLTSAAYLLIYNVTAQIQYVFVLSLPSQARTLSLNAMYYSLVSLGNPDPSSKVQPTSSDSALRSSPES